jgi:hypothetical protein
MRPAATHQGSLAVSPSSGYREHEGGLLQTEIIDDGTYHDAAPHELADHILPIVAPNATDPTNN